MTTTQETVHHVNQQETVVKHDKSNYIPVPKASASVEVGISHTKNIGNYESLKFHVGITLPCAPEKADAAYQLAGNWCQEKLENLVDTMTGEPSKSNNKPAPAPVAPADPVGSIGPAPSPNSGVAPMMPPSSKSDLPPWNLNCEQPRQLSQGD